MAEPIKDTTGGAGLLQTLLGQQTSTNTAGSTLAQQLQQMLTSGATTGTTGGSSTATTTNTAELGPLIQAFAQASGGMDPAQLTALISSIFTEGAAQVPALTTQYANSTGSRVSGNSGLNLALGDLNRQLSTQAVQALLGYNQQSQATAGNIASNIANATRSTQQQGAQQQQTAGTTQQSQQQVGTTNTNQTQQSTAKQGVNPAMAGLVGAGGTALNWLDKKGAFDSLFGRNPAGGAGTIGTGGIMPNGPMLTNGGGGGAGMLSTPSASQGFLQGPVASNPYSYSPGGGTVAGGGAGSTGVVPTFNGFAPSGITNFGGFGSTSGGLLGTAGNMAFGGLPAGTDVFGTAGTDSLGSGLNFGSNPYGYTPDGSGITGAMDPGGGWGGAFTQGIGNALGGAADWLGGLAGGAADWIGSFFANGGMVGPRTAYADGGQVETGSAPPRVRNQNYLGQRLDERDRTGALNYEGYASPTPSGSSVPAGGSPSLGGVSPAIAAIAPSTPGSGAISSSPAEVAAQARNQYAQSIAFQEALAAAARGQGGGSGGVGEGAAPGESESGNGQAGIGPSGIAAAPNGTANAVGLASGLMGMQSPAMMLNLIAMIAAMVNQANQTNASGAASGIAGLDADDGSTAGITVGDLGVVDGQTIGAVTVGDAGGSGGDGGSGVGSGGATGGSTSGEGGNGGGNYADGGRVRGPGTGTSDSIRVKSKQPGGKDIYYSDGEYVIPKDVVDAVGVNHFDTLLDAFHTSVSR